jgi:hypothetical protein
MSEQLEISEKAIIVFANAAERFIGYCYSGFLPVCIAALENPDFVKKTVEATGGLLTAIICVVLGIGIYTIYFRVLGNFFIFPLQHVIHYLIDLILRRSPEARTSSVGLIIGYGVPKKCARIAYHKVRDKFFTGRYQIEIQLSHGELHVLYITAVITLGSYIILNSHGLSPTPIYMYASASCFIAALIGDTHQHAVEAALVKAKQSEVKEFLQQEGLM